MLLFLSKVVVSLNCRMNDDKNCKKMNNQEMNLMMVAAYHQRAYENFVSDQIAPDQLRELNEGIVKAKIMLKTTRETIFSLQYHGKRHTMAFGNGMALRIDTLIDELNEITKLVNKTKGQINLADYPVEESA